MAKAIEVVKKKEMSVFAASKYFKVPRTTLRNYIQCDGNRKSTGRPSVLTEEQENLLSDNIIYLAELGSPMSLKNLREMVCEFCIENNIEHRFNEGKAGKNWLRGFLKRHPEISERKDELFQRSRRSSDF